MISGTLCDAVLTPSASWIRAVLTDKTGERFMKPVHELAELAPRDVVARAVHRQNARGLGAFLDCREAIGDAFPDRFPAVFAACQRAGIDPRVEPIPVAPTAHYHMGGVKTDVDGRTNVDGLWAIGECASSGLHGANRLASNSLAEGLVAAARCVKAMSRGAGRDLSPPPRKPGTSPANGGGKLPHLALQRLRQAMSRHCGVERSASGLEELLELIRTLETSHGPADALVAARFIVTAALRRTESRGGHFRTDYPATADTAAHSVCTLADLDQPSTEATRHSVPAE